MLLTLVTPQNTSTDLTEEDPDLAGLGVDPILGFARVISQVKTNTKQFRGWGP
jgi:hypothetical protein